MAAAAQQQQQPYPPSLQHIDPLTKLPEALRHQSAQLFGSALAPHPNTGDLRRYDAPLSNYNDITSTYVDNGVISTWATTVMNAILKNRAASTLLAIVPLYLTTDLQFSFSWTDPFLVSYEQMSEMGIPAMVTDTKHSAQSNMSFFKLGAEIESNYAADPRFGNEALEMKVMQLIEGIYLTFNILIVAGLMRFSAQVNAKILGEDRRDDPERAKYLEVAEAACFGAAALGPAAFREAIFRMAEVQDIDAVVVHPNPRLMHSNANSRPVYQTIIDTLDGSIQEKQITLDRKTMDSVNYNGKDIDIIATGRLYESITKRVPDGTKNTITLASLFRGGNGHALSANSHFPGAIQIRSMTASHYTRETFTPLDCLLQSPYYNDEGVPSEALHMYVEHLNQNGWVPDDLFDGDAKNQKERADAYENPRTATMDIHNSSNPFATFDPASGRNYISLVLGGFPLSSIQPGAMAEASVRIAKNSNLQEKANAALELLVEFARKCRAQEVTTEYAAWVQAQVTATGAALSDNARSTALGVDQVLESVTDGATGAFVLTDGSLPGGNALSPMYPPGYDTLPGIMWLSTLDKNDGSLRSNSLKPAIEDAQSIAPLFQNRALRNALQAAMGRSLIMEDTEIPMWLGPNAPSGSLAVEIYLQYALGKRNNGPLFCVKGGAGAGAASPALPLIQVGADGVLQIREPDTTTTDGGAAINAAINAAFPVADIGGKKAAYAASNVLNKLIKKTQDPNERARALAYAASSRTFKDRIVGNDIDFDAEVARLINWTGTSAATKKFASGEPAVLNLDNIGIEVESGAIAQVAPSGGVDVMRVPLRLSRKWIEKIKSEATTVNSPFANMMVADPASHFTRYYPNDAGTIDQLLQTADLSAHRFSTSPSNMGLNAKQLAEFHRKRVTSQVFSAKLPNFLDAQGEWKPQHELSDADAGFVGPFSERLGALQSMGLSPLEQFVYIALVFAPNTAQTFSALYRKAKTFLFRAAYWAMRMRLETRQAVAIDRSARSLVLASSPVRAVVEEDKIGDLTQLASSFRAAVCQTGPPSYVMMPDVEICSLVGGFTAQVSNNPNAIKSDTFGLGDLMALPEPLSLQLVAPVAMLPVEGADPKSRSPHAHFINFFLGLAGSGRATHPIEHIAEFGVVWDYEETGWGAARAGTGRLGSVRMHLPGAEKVLNGENSYFPEEARPRMAYT